MAAPVLPPLQSTLLMVVAELKALGCVMVIVLLEVQALASVTVTVLAPAFKVLITELVAAVDHKYE